MRPTTPDAWCWPTAPGVGSPLRSSPSGPTASSIPEGIPFERLAVSEDGQRVAAAADAAKEPMVCVWETKKGNLTHWITTDRLEDAVLALAFSATVDTC